MKRILLVNILIIVILTMPFCLVAQDITVIGDSYTEYTEPQVEYIDVPQTTLTINSNTSKVSVYINSVYYGTTPFSTQKLPAGVYYVRLVKNDYYTRAFYVELKEGRETYIYAELERITGILDISATPKNVEVYIDGSYYSSTRIELPEGFHQIRIQKFGYEEYNNSVYVIARKTQRLTVNLQPAPFSVSQIRPSRSAFNPHNPGLLGTVQFIFSVTNREYGEIRIYDSSGVEIKKILLTPYNTWQQSVTWDGTDTAGLALADGTYDVVLETGDFTRRTSVKINTAIQYTLLPEVQSALLPKGSIAMVFYAEPFILLEPPANSLNAAGFLATPLSFKIFGAPFSWLQIGAQAGMIISGGYSVPFLLGANIQVAVPLPTPHIALTSYVQYVFITDDTLVMGKNLYTLDSGLQWGISAQWYTPFGFLTAYVAGLLGDIQGKITAFEPDIQLGIASDFMLGITQLHAEVGYTFFAEELNAKLDFGVLIPGTNGIGRIGIRFATQKSSSFILSPVIGFSLLF